MAVKLKQRQHQIMVKAETEQAPDGGKAETEHQLARGKRNR
jgi:hypothetical protein